MNKNNYQLSPREEELMEMLWHVNKPMTTQAMLKEDYPRSWKDSYITIMIRSLLEKEAIQVCGIERSGRNYLRQFVPSYTKEEYAARLVASKVDVTHMPDVMLALAKVAEKNIDDKHMAKVIAAMAKDDDTEVDDELIERLESIIKEIRE